MREPLTQAIARAVAFRLVRWLAAKQAREFASSKVMILLLPAEEEQRRAWTARVRPTDVVRQQMPNALVLSPGLRRNEWGYRE